MCVCLFVVEGDAGCRLLMCEKSAWSPLPVMISLLCLHVPAALKAQLLVTLEAFARSAEVATLLWHELESAQLLQTRRTTLPPRGIQVCKTIHTSLLLYNITFVLLF